MYQMVHSALMTVPAINGPAINGPAINGPAPTRPAESEPRARLLAAAIEYLQARGISELSLRELAAAIGTSHRMLIYHFGSKEGLLVAVVQAVEEQQRVFLAGLAADPAVGPREAITTMWRHFADTRLWPAERLFFEIYGLALQGRPGTAGFLDGIVDDWLEMLTQYSIQLGSPPDHARADARLGVAVMRGLLLDLLATGDRAGIDEAVERFILLAEAAARPGPG
jgi:AcrR family transcriptional regulator